MAKTKSKLWSYNAGKKGVSWVRVFERRHSTVSLYAEWFWQGKRVTRALRSVVGHPVTDRRLAMQIADRMANELERKQNDEVFRKLEVNAGEDIPRLAKTMADYHEAKAKIWSDHHRAAMERRRDFWLKQFGPEVPLPHITPAMVESADMSGSGSTQRKTLMYMRGLYTWAIKKARVLPLSYDLSGIEMPGVTKGGLSYTIHEIRELLLALEEESPEAAWMGQVAWQTGRRLGAILAVEPEDCHVFDDYALITFRSDHDKANKTGDAALTGRGVELTKLLLATDRNTMTNQTSDTAQRGWLYRAEERAGIPRIKGRGWHSFKRAFATAADNMGAASKQSGTRRETLTGIYEQDWGAPKVELAEQMWKLSQ